ncbi:MAG: hypothetical protein HOW73_12110 [Polyangiaceae bacterium]|nr:hypothetical protein [Polyangiaceae bacterium]
MDSKCSAWLLTSVLSLAACGDQNASTASAQASGTAVTAASSAPAPAPAAGEVAITKHYPAAGDKTTRERTQKFVMVTKEKGHADIEGTSTYIVNRSEECLAIEGKLCSKVKVTYTANERKSAIGGSNMDRSSPTAGKTYIVEAKNGATSVTREDGAALTPEERKDVEPHYRHFAEPKDALAALPDKVKVGDSLDDFAKALAEQMADTDDGEKPTVTISMKVKAIRDEGGKKIVVLDVEQTNEGNDKKLGKKKSKRKGTMELRADTGLLVASDFNDELENVFPNGVDSMKGTATEQTKVTYSF